MSNLKKYQIPKEYFFRLHHVRPRFKNNPEDVLLHYVNSLNEIGVSEKQLFKNELDNKLRDFGKNATRKPKTIANWRTEISALFAFIQEKSGYLQPSKTAIRLADSQYLDEFFNYFLYSFQYPGGYLKSHQLIPQIQAGIKFKPCHFILCLLLEGGKLIGKPFSLTAEELTHCAYFDLRVTRDGKHHNIQRGI